MDIYVNSIKLMNLLGTFQLFLMPDGNTFQRTEIDLLGEVVLSSSRFTRHGPSTERRFLRVLAHVQALFVYHPRLYTPMSIKPHHVKGRPHDNAYRARICNGVIYCIRRAPRYLLAR